MTGARATIIRLQQRWRRLTALAAGAAWLLTALTCPSFGLTLGPDEPVAAHEQVTHGATGQTDTDVCCKALGDSAAVFQSISYLQPDLAATPAPTIAIAEVPPTGLFFASLPDRPPLYETTRSRAKRFVTFSSHAPPTTASE